MAIQEKDKDIVGGNAPDHSIGGRALRRVKGVVHDGIATLASAALRPGAIENPNNVKKFRKHGIHVVKDGFYAPIDPETIDALDPNTEQEFPGIDFRPDAQQQVLSMLSGFAEEYAQFPTKEDPRRPETFFLENGAFDNVDAFVYYGLIRSFGSEHIMEIGAGHSTKLAAQALEANRTGTLTAVDPYPRPFLRNIPNLKLIEKRVEKMDPDEITNSLVENDILFIDSSHVVRQGGDVAYLFNRILPTLPGGVYVHVHDIYFPGDYPKELSQERLVYWNEQYLLQAHLANNPTLEVIFGSQYALRKFPELVHDAFPAPYNTDGASFWFRTR